MTINELYAIIEDRRRESGKLSYTRSLFDNGLDRIIQKVGEESVEVVIAAKNSNKNEFIGEAADLIYHLLVLLVEKNVTVTDIENKLQERYDQKNITTKEI